MQITAIPDRDIDEDWVGWLNSFVTIDEILFNPEKGVAIPDLVGRVLKRSAHRKITRLNIVDHGAAKTDKYNGHLRFGDVLINKDNYENFERHFRKLAKRFHHNGFVHLGHCFAGTQLPLLRKFAKSFGVPVWGGMHWDYHSLGGNWSGEYREVLPSGKAFRRSKRP